MTTTNSSQKLVSSSAWAIAMIHAVAKYVEVPTSQKDNHEIAESLGYLYRFSTNGVNDWEDFLMIAILKIVKDKQDGCGQTFYFLNQLLKHISLLVRSRFIDAYRQQKNRARILHDYHYIGRDDQRSCQLLTAERSVALTLSKLQTLSQDRSNTRRTNDIGRMMPAELISMHIKGMKNQDIAASLSSAQKPTAAQTRRACRSLAVAKGGFREAYVEVNGFDD